MKVVVTHVDKLTRISVETAPPRNGPTLPDIPGLVVLLAKTSKFPTNVPEFLCEVPDGDYASVDGVVASLTEEEFIEQRDQEVADRVAHSNKLKADPIRKERDRLLEKSDKYLFADFPIDEQRRAAWTLYRQSLRDITSQPSFPDDVQWPTPPAL